MYALTVLDMPRFCPCCWGFNYLIEMMITLVWQLNFDYDQSCWLYTFWLDFTRNSDGVGGNYDGNHLRFFQVALIDERLFPARGRRPN